MNSVVSDVLEEATMKRDDQTRRGFVGKVAAIGAAVAATGAGATTVSAGKSTSGRGVVGGSPDAAFSRAVIFDRVVFVSGVVGLNPDTGELASPSFAPQCRQVLENLRASVEAAGSSMDRVLKCTCFLTDIADFATYNKTYASFFPSSFRRTRPLDRPWS
jgi:2-iminobutanoate/2-iminopropanoate deaminase